MKRTRRSARTGVCAAVCAWVGCWAGAAWAAGPSHVIVDANLKRIPGELIELTPERVRYTDEAGAARTLPADQVLAIVPGRREDLGEPVAAEAAGRGLASRIVLELTDGQRLVGQLAATQDRAEGAKEESQEAADAVVWETRLFGRFTAPLDRVRKVVLHPEAMPKDARALEREGKDDEVVLLNGDRVAGLIESIGASVVIETGGKPMTLAAERVAAVMLANPEAARPAKMVRLKDGSAVAVAEVRTTEDSRVELTLPPGAGGPGEGARAVVEMQDVEAVWLDGGRVVELARLPVEKYEALAGRRWTRGPAVHAEAGDIEIPGPMSVEWVLPAATRIAGTLVMPRRSQEWGDAQVTIEVVSDGQRRELARARLNAEHPSADFNAELAGMGAGDRLRLRLEPGGDEAVQDRVVLRDVVLRRP